MRRLIVLSIWLSGAAFCGFADASEVTMQNDSLTNNSQGVIVPGFVHGEAAATWLTSTCTGNIVALDVLWRSFSGGAAQSVLLQLEGPQMTDGVINEYRYLDPQQTIPVNVPVLQNQTFVVAFFFLEAPNQAEGPSVVADVGCQEGKNAIFAVDGTGSTWLSSCVVGVSGDWVIRAVVDCESVATSADVAVAMGTEPDLYTPGSTLNYIIALENAGPDAAANTSVVDIFPASYTNVSWTCAATGGAVCTSGTSGSGHITSSVYLPKAGQITYSTTGTIAMGATGTISNSATAVVVSPATDPDDSNNTATLNTAPLSDRIFASSFE